MNGEKQYLFLEEVSQCTKNKIHRKSASMDANAERNLKPKQDIIIVTNYLSPSKHLGITKLINIALGKSWKITFWPKGLD